MEITRIIVILFLQITAYYKLTCYQLAVGVHKTQPGSIYEAFCRLDVMAN